MKAFDTCVLARAIVGDDPAQAELAVAQLEVGGFVPLTVMLELAWLLRSRYRYSRALVAETLADLCLHPALAIASEASMPWVIERIQSGADVADLIHLVASEGCDAFLTFDDMRREVGDSAPMMIELLI